MTRRAPVFLSYLAFCGLLPILLATGCSSFKREWKTAASVLPPANEITGRWTGSWRSEKNGHHGALRCLVTRLDSTRYRARYKATYWKIMRFGYTVTLNVERDDDPVHNFKGEADLGWWGGGVYHYVGHATPTEFYSTYRSGYDHGTFRMKRPE